MRVYQIVMMALALAFAGAAEGQALDKSLAYDRAAREYQEFVRQFPAPEQTRVENTKQYTEALANFEQTVGQDMQRYSEALARFEQSTKTFEQASETFQRAVRQYQRFLDSFPTK